MQVTRVHGPPMYASHKGAWSTYVCKSQGCMVYLCMQFTRVHGPPMYASHKGVWSPYECTSQWCMVPLCMQVTRVHGPPMYASHKGAWLSMDHMYVCKSQETALSYYVCKSQKSMVLLRMFIGHKIAWCSYVCKSQECMVPICMYVTRVHGPPMYVDHNVVGFHQIQSCTCLVENHLHTGSCCMI